MKMVRAIALLPLRVFDLIPAVLEASRNSRRQEQELSSLTRSISCWNCEKPAAFKIQSRDYNDAVSEEVFSYFSCTHCGLIMLDPVPPDLGRYYKNDYPAYDQSFIERGMARARHHIEMLLPFKSRGALLDIGAGIGLFVRLAHRAGFETTVIEADEGCCRVLREQLKITAHCSVRPHEVELPKEHYDVITLWHSIEHLPQSLDCLKAAVAWLKPGGVLLIATPNVDSLQFRLFGRWWHHLDAPRHVCFYPSQTLTSILERQGLRRETLTCSDRGGLVSNYSSWMLSLSNRVSSRRRKAALAMAGRILFVLMLPLEIIGLRGSAYTAIFRKNLANP